MTERCQLVRVIAIATGAAELDPGDDPKLVAVKVRATELLAELRAMPLGTLLDLAVIMEDECSTIGKDDVTGLLMALVRCAKRTTLGTAH